MPSNSDRRLSSLLPPGGPFGRPHKESLRDKSHAENVRWAEVQLYIKGEEWVYHPVILQAKEKNSKKGTMADMKAHSLKVAAACPFIKDLIQDHYLSSELNLSKSIKIELPIDGRVLKYIVEYMYIGTMKVTADLAHSIFEACHVLGLTTAKALVGEWLGNQVHDGNALRLFQASFKFGCPELENVAGKYVEANFLTVTQSEDWQKLSEQMVREVLSRDNLAVTAESQVLHSLIEWAKYTDDEESRALRTRSSSASMKTVKNPEDEERDGGPPPKRKEALERLMLDRKAVRLPYMVDGKVVRQMSRSQKSFRGGTLGRISINMRKRFGGNNRPPSNISEETA